MEPGIWAAQAPREVAAVIVLGEPIPLPEATDARADGTPAAACRDRIHAVRDGDPLLAQAISVLTPQERACLATLLFRACIGSMLANPETLAASLRPSAVILERDAREAMEMACKTGATEKMTRLSDRWLSRWARALR
jgi:hypothetical protein